MKIVLENKESEELFHAALCNGLGYMCGGYNMELVYSKTAYKEARDRVYVKDMSTCYEDVLLEMLRSGHSLKLHCRDEEEIHSIDINAVHERVQETQTNHLMDMMNERDDAVTADVILQTVFLGEIVYG